MLQASGLPEVPPVNGDIRHERAGDADYFYSNTGSSRCSDLHERLPTHSARRAAACESWRTSFCASTGRGRCTNRARGRRTQGSVEARSVRGPDVEPDARRCWCDLTLVREPRLAPCAPHPAPGRHRPSCGPMPTASIARPLQPRSPCARTCSGASTASGTAIASVYCKTLLANATPPVLEPLFFFTRGRVRPRRCYMPGGRLRRPALPRLTSPAGMVVSSAMFTGHLRDHVRHVRPPDLPEDVRLRCSARTCVVNEVFIGEMLFSATKGAVSSQPSSCSSRCCLRRPADVVVSAGPGDRGHATAYLFAVDRPGRHELREDDQQLYVLYDGILAPVFFFSGTFFPVLGHYNRVVDAVATAVPLTASIELSRALFKAHFSGWNWLHLAILLAYLSVCHVAAVRRMTRRVLG